MDVAGNKLGERINNSDNRLAKIAVLHACGTPKAARTGHVTAVSGSSGTIMWHEVPL